MDNVEDKEEQQSKDNKTTGTLFPSRHNLQLGRRLFHMAMGITVALVYLSLADQHHAVYLLGGAASILYLFEQVRISYPEFSDKFKVVTKYFMRAEERLKESAMIPYIMGLILTILSFPKKVAITSILILAIADPLCAIFGIIFGEKKIWLEKSWAGSLAFFFSSFFVIILNYWPFDYDHRGAVFLFCFISTVIITLFELLPIRLDDNLTIPIFSSIVIWSLSTFL